MNYLEQKLGRDVFGLVLEYFDPIKDKQIKRKLVINKCFRNCFPLRSSMCWIWNLRSRNNDNVEGYVKRNINIYNVGIPDSFIREIYGKRYRSYGRGIKIKTINNPSNGYKNRINNISTVTIAPFGRVYCN